MARGFCAQLTDVVPLSLECHAAELPFVTTHKIDKRLAISLYETGGNKLHVTTQPESERDHEASERNSAAVGATFRPVGYAIQPTVGRLPGECRSSICCS